MLRYLKFFFGVWVGHILLQYLLQKILICLSPIFVWLSIDEAWMNNDFHWPSTLYIHIFSNYRIGRKYIIKNYLFSASVRIRSSGSPHFPPSGGDGCESNEFISVNLILVDNSERRRSPHTWQEAPPSRFQRDWDNQYQIASSCSKLGLSRSTFVKPAQFRPSSSTVSCISLPIPLLGFSGVGRVQFGLFSPILTPWVALQEI